MIIHLLKEIKLFSAPEKKLKIVFKNFFVEESDTGDFYNASSIQLALDH